MAAGTSLTWAVDRGGPAAETLQDEFVVTGADGPTSWSPPPAPPEHALMSTTGAYRAAGPRQVTRPASPTALGTRFSRGRRGAFTGQPVVTVAVQAGAGFRAATVTANSATGTTVNVQAAAGVTLLGIGVLAAAAPAANVTVHITATAAAG